MVVFSTVSVTVPARASVNRTHKLSLSKQSSKATFRLCSSVLISDTLIHDGSRSSISITDDRGEQVLSGVGVVSSSCDGGGDGDDSSVEEEEEACNDVKEI